MAEPQQDGGAARIYQFNLYGTASPDESGFAIVRHDLPDGMQPVCDLVGRRVGMSVVKAGLV